MATSQVASSVDVLSKEERKMVVDALALRSAQLRRALIAEKNEEIAAIRSKEIEAVHSLALKFS